MSSLTIVTVTHNSSAVLASLLEPLQACGHEIIVVDNGSTDGTQALAHSFSGVRLMQCANIGYGQAANKAFREVKTPYVLLLNPDVVVSFEAIEHMLACMQERPELGILGANLTDEVGEGMLDVDWIVGALMLIRMEALHKVGFFDEQIFLFYEETDLCLRFVQAGYALAVLQSAVARHAPGTSTPSCSRVVKIKAWHSAWSRAYYYHKHYAWPSYFRKCLSKMTTNCIRMCMYALCGDWLTVRKNFYEWLGTFAYISGVQAFEGDEGRFA